MLQNLASYLLGSVTAQQPDAATDGGDTRLTTARYDDDWVLVDRTDRDSEGESEAEESEGEERALEWAWPGPLDLSEMIEEAERLNASPLPPALTRASSTGSIPAAHYMEESWFITPPPCFTSAGPVHMATSPLENLLIEHPSMSVYHHAAASMWRRQQRPRSRSASPGAAPADEGAGPAPAGAELREERAGRARRGAAVGAAARGLNRLCAAERQEKERAMGRKAQKAQAKRAYENVARQQLARINAVKQVLNRRQRRGERSQGAQRSCVNNNRKCC